MKYLGIDFGSKRIGVAVSDEGGTIAFPLTTIAGGERAAQEVVALAQKEGAEKIVLGESRDYAGAANPVAKAAEEFKQALEAAGVSVVYEPEFMTSSMAARQWAPDGSRKQNPSQENLDAAAAALILQSYLDRQGVK